MKSRYWQALTVLAFGTGTVILGVTNSNSLSVVGLFIGAASFPVAVLLAVSSRLDETPPIGSLIGGGTIGPLIAILSHAFVFGFAYLFFFEFAEDAASLLETFRIDPQLVDVAGSPWTILLFIELVLVAPFTEEIGKAMGASVQRPSTRAEAFMAGVTAGVGFSIVENILYAAGGLFLGPSWEAIVAVRMLGAAVHPLASGLVVMGWWEWRQRRDAGLLARRFLSGVGVHALWNGSIVVLGVVGEAYGVDRLLGFGALGVAYSAGLGAIAMAVLWRTSRAVADDDAQLVVFDGTDSKTIGAWTVLAASLLVPVALLFLAYPEIVGG